MKARVKTTGEIVEIIRNSAFDKDVFYDSNGQKYNRDELSFDVNEISFPNYEPDYWDKLKHQAVISAMQGLLSNSAYLKSFEKNCIEGDHLARVVSRNAIDYATILINKLKEEENESK